MQIATEQTVTAMIMNIKGKVTLSVIPSALEEAISPNGFFPEVVGVAAIVTWGPNMQMKVYFCELLSSFILHTGKYGSFQRDLAHGSTFCHVYSYCGNIGLHMHACTVICIPLNATPLGENDHNHVRAHLPSLRASVLQNKNLARAADILSSMVHS